MTFNMIAGIAGLVALIAAVALILMMPVPFKYNLRNLRVRWVTAVMTSGGILAVSLVFVWFSALGTGMERALVESGHPLNVIVLRSGAQTETNSIVSKKNADDIAIGPGVARDADDQPLASAEVMAIANLPKVDGGKANIAMRGVGPLGRDLRGNIRVRDGGRWFRPGLFEIVVGSGARGRFAGLNVGDKPFIRGAEWTVVGIFDADGQAYESEIWADVEKVRDQFKRTEYSAVLVRCADEKAIEPFMNRVREDRNLKLEAKRHTEYYKSQNQGAQMLKAMGFVMAVVLSIGIVFGAANTMFAAVAARTREIATMRVLGFSRLSIWFSFMVEAALLGLIGGAVGALIAYAAFDGMTTGTANWATFSELAFKFRVTPELMIQGTALSIVMAMIGGFLPAWRAARATIATALRGL